MKKKKILKGIKDIRNKREYDLSSTINDMKSYYSDNNFDNIVLLERLHQIKADKLFMDSFLGGIIGLLLGALVLNSDVANSATATAKAAFSSGMFTGFVILVSLLIIFLIFVIVFVSGIYLIKFMYQKIVKSDVVANFLDEKEVEIINQILNDRINSQDK